MAPLRRILHRLASPEDRELLASEPPTWDCIRVAARIGLRYVWVYFFILVLGIALTGVSGMDIYHRTEMPQFCTLCHEMGGNFGSWRISLHKSIRCVDCHARPGLSGWMEAKIGGLRQLGRHFTAKTIGDIHLDSEQRGLVSENCRRCHAGATRLTERAAIVVSHDRHLAMGIECVQCHSRAFVHPPENVAAEGNHLLVDTADCFRCHDGERPFPEATAFDATRASNCLRCHPDAGLGNQHGGVENECGYCHGARDDGHFPLDEAHVETVCTECHETEKDLTSSHEAYHTGRCGKCHLVMSPAHLFLSGSTPEPSACLGCHGDLAAVLAEQEGATATRFADEGTGDLHLAHGWALEDEGFWCTGCHSPHGSRDAAHLLRLRPLSGAGAAGRWEATAGGGRCTGACHGDDAVSYERGTAKSP